MASLALKLEEQLSDQRSNEIAYRLTIENTDSKPIRLQAVVPRVPVGANLLEVTNSSLAETSARKAELIAELTLLLRQYLWVVSEEFRKQLVERTSEKYKEFYGSLGSILRMVVKLLVGPWTWVGDISRYFESFQFNIHSASDARSAHARWMTNVNEHVAIRSLFEAKLEQLERIEAQMGGGDNPGLTVIEAGSYFAATYVIRFSRGVLEPRKYQVGFNATYQEPEKSAEGSASTATNVQISPYPLSLSIVAVASAILGALLRLSLGGSHNPLADLILSATSGELLVGPVIALIFFNVYEYTSVGKELGISVSWRSALLIGAVCGIAQERVLAALKALFGA
jgi:hypothetical protein